MKLNHLGEMAESRTGIGEVHNGLYLLVIPENKGELKNDRLI